MNKEKRAGRSPLEIYEESKAQKEAHEKSFEAQLEKIIRDAFPSNAEVIAMSRKSNYEDQPSESIDMGTGPGLTECEEISEEVFLWPTNLVFDQREMFKRGARKEVTFVKQGQQSSTHSVNDIARAELLPRVQDFLYQIGGGGLKESEYNFGDPDMLYMVLNSEPHKFKVCYQLDLPSSYMLDQLITACLESFEAMLEDKIKQDSKRKVLDIVRPKILK